MALTDTVALLTLHMIIYREIF